MSKENIIYAGNLRFLKEILYFRRRSQISEGNLRFLEEITICISYIQCPWRTSPRRAAGGGLQTTREERTLGVKTWLGCGTVPVIVSVPF